MGGWNKGRGKCYLWIMAHLDYQGSECLDWPFGTCNGYGFFGHLDEQHYAHRFICEIKNGPQPEGNYHAAHSCGRGDKGCVNHNHISWKTVTRNQLDRAGHGTKNSGRTGKITAHQKAEIIDLRGKLTQREIAAKMGITRSRVGIIQTTHLKKIKG